MSQYNDPQDKRMSRIQAQKQKREKYELDAAVKGLLKSGEGRRYLFWLLDIGKAVGANPFTGHALSTSFQCGEQNVGQQVMAHILEVSPDGFLMMLKEREDERKELAASVGNRGTDDGSASDRPEPDAD